MITTLYKTLLPGREDPGALQLLRRFREAGYSNLVALKRERVLRVEGEKPDVAKLTQLFCYPGVELVATVSMLSPIDGPIVEVSYQRAITDPELDSILHATQALKISDVRWVRLATRYQFMGNGTKVTMETAQEIVQRWLCNPQVETIIEPGVEWDTLIPQGEAGGVEEIEVRSMTLDELRQLSNSRRLFMPDEQLLALKEKFTILGRPARDGEVEMFAAGWSDHCFHTTWKRLRLFQKLQATTRRIAHPLELSSFVGNSGIMRFYEGWALNVKGETHISPTFGGSPYGGIMTKIGGVLRDILFTFKGAWIWASTTVMAICDPRLPWDKVPKGAIHPLVVLRESIRGIFDYSNPMGIPMAWSEYRLHQDNWKGFALGHAVGILPEACAKRELPTAGDFVVYIGGPRGRDGLHGATVSSGAITSRTSTVDAAHVQIGMPIEERKMMEAIPVLRDAGCIKDSTDCGAAGLSSAVGEMGSHIGVWVNLAWVPLKCAAIKMWEIWLSESQEGGVLCVPAEKLTVALGILTDYNVPAAVIGLFTDSRRCQVVYDQTIDYQQWTTSPTSNLQGSIVVDLPYEFLNEGCPLPAIEVREPQRQLKPFVPPLPRTSSEWLDLIRRHLGHFNICDQSAAAHQFDQTVQGNTVLTYVGGRDERMPDELFVATPLRRKRYGAGKANAMSQFYGELDPAGMGQLIYAQAVARLVAAGFSPRDILCNVNVYSPCVTDSPAQAWRLKALVEDGYIVASEKLGVPVISGKDSSNGTFITEDGQRIDAPLTLDVLAMGRMPDVSRLITKPFRQPGDQLVLYYPGLQRIELGGSVLLDLFQERGAALPQLDLAELQVGFMLYHQMLDRLGWSKGVHSRSVVAEGGLIRRLFEMSWGSGLGCNVSLWNNPLEWLFGELNAAILFAASSAKWREVLPGSYRVIGEVISQPTIHIACGGDQLLSATTQELATHWSETFTEVAL